MFGELQKLAAQSWVTNQDPQSPPILSNYGDTPTTGLNLTEAPSRLVRSRIRGDVDDIEFDAYVIVYAVRSCNTTSSYAFCRSSMR